MPHLPIPSSPDLPPEDVGPQQPFFQRPLVQQLVPWLTSFAFHVGVIVLAYLVYKTVETVRHAYRQEQILIPDTNLVDAADAGGMPNPGLDDDPTRAAAQGADDSMRDNNDWAKRKSETLAATLAEGSAERQRDVTPIGAAQASSSDVLTGLKQPGLGAGGSLAPFGPAGGGGGQGKGLFGLPGGNIRKIAYVCDASGSMAGTLQTLLNFELREAIAKLRTNVQSFNVVMFQNGEPATIRRGTLLIATERNKQFAYDFLNRYEVRGSTDPLPALREAFAMRPELVFLLTDGAFDEPEKVVAELDKLNVNRKVRVNTILFVATDPDNPAARPIVEEAERTMKQLAKDHGGTYRLVRPVDLQR